MAFRADDERSKGLERAISYLVPRGASQHDRDAALEVIYDIEERYGPVIEHYPSWHPLMSYKEAKTFRNNSFTSPCRDNGYAGVDHTICFVNAFITCPYDGGEKILESVRSRPKQKIARVDAKIIDAKLYAPSATSVLVTCDWYVDLNHGNVIPKQVAIGLMLEEEIPQWRNAEVGETWDSMKSYFLGSPRGAKSSLFVDQETGQAMKTVWNAVINTGLYGPIKV
ncbi:UNVERIFIED_ORG: hypothetical protein FHW05_000275 [Pantoea agglomerans]